MVRRAALLPPVAAVFLLAVLLAVLGGCDSPTPGVMAWQRAEVEAGGMRFGVHWAGDRVEAWRISRHWRPHLSAVRANAAVAIRQATGCPPRPGSLAGDQAVVTAELACPGG